MAIHLHLISQGRLYTEFTVTEAPPHFHLRKERSKVIFGLKKLELAANKKVLTIKH